MRVVAYSIWVGVLAVLASPAHALPLRFRDALERAEQQNPQLRQSSAQRDAAHFRIGRAYAAYLPSLGLVVNASGGYSNTPYTDFDDNGQLITIRPWLPSVSYAAALSLNQRVTDFGRTSGAVAGARATEHQAGYDLDVARQNVDMAVAQAYVELLRNAALLAISDAAIVEVEAQLRHARALFKVSMRSEIDVLSAETQLAQVKLARLRTLNAYQAGQLQLRNALGETGAATYDAVPLPGTAVRDEALGPEQLVESALRERTELKSLHAQVDAARAAVRTIHAEYFPIVSASLSGQAYGSNLAWVPGMSAVASVNVAADLFSGLATRRGEQEARAQLRAVGEALEQLRQRIALSVSNAVIALGLARESLVVSRAARQLADRQLKIAVQRYETGIGNFVELNDARNNAINVQTQEARATYDVLLARASLLRELGRPLRELDEAP